MPEPNPNSTRERKRLRHEAQMQQLGQVLVSDRGLSITYVPGSERPEELLVVICGANLQMGGATPETMMGIERSRGRRAALVVADVSMSFFTDLSLVKRMEAEVRRMVERLGGPRVVTMGNSIGGHAAMHLARRLRAEVALGFAPIFSTDIRVHAEERWPNAQRRLKTEGMATIGDDMSPGCRYVAIYAADTPVECRHYAALSRVPGVEVRLIERGGHRIPLRLERKGVLAEIVEAVLADEPMPDRFEAMLADEDTVTEALDIIAGEIGPDGRPYGPFTAPEPQAAAPS